MSELLSDVGLPAVNDTLLEEIGGATLYENNGIGTPVSSQELVQSQLTSRTTKQCDIFQAIEGRICDGNGSLMFVHGPAASGIASLLILDRGTSHAKLGIPLTINKTLTCSFTRSDMDNSLQELKLEHVKIKHLKPTQPFDKDLIYCQYSDVPKLTNANKWSKLGHYYATQAVFTPLNLSVEAMNAFMLSRLKTKLNVYALVNEMDLDWAKQSVIYEDDQMRPDYNLRDGNVVPQPFL
ncbi:hypothetical protein DFH28DRAFT_923048 [Melampsora americana]|nr:hypothetical protein DFH28DRAFT_923048 [Melampsora americana]